MSYLDSTAIAIVGNRGSGKTALACSFLEQVTNRPVWVYQHPKPELVVARGWNAMFRLEQMYEIDNAVAWIDEPQLSIQKLDKRANDGLQRLLSIARHRDITLIISTCDTRWITRALESYIDVWCVKDVDIALVKQGSLIKKIVQKYVICDPDEFKLKPNEYLIHGREFPDLNGKQTFTKPVWFDMAWSKPYSLKSAQTATQVATQVATNGKVTV